MRTEIRADGEASVSGDPLATGLLGRPGAGVFSVTIGDRRRDRLVARWCGYRRAGLVPIRLAIVHTPSGQRWTRSIGGRDIVSTVAWSEGTVVEQFGAVRLAFRAVLDGNAARLELQAVALVLGPLQIRVARWIAPSVACRTRLTDIGLRVRVEVRGRRGHGILAYEGVVA